MAKAFIYSIFWELLLCSLAGFVTMHSISSATEGRQSYCLCFDRLIEKAETRLNHAAIRSLAFVSYLDSTNRRRRCATALCIDEELHCLFRDNFAFVAVTQQNHDNMPRMLYCPNRSSSFGGKNFHSYPATEERQSTYLF